MAEVFVNEAQSYLNALLTSGGTSLVVNSASQFPSSGSFRIRIEEAPPGSGNNVEYVSVGSVSGNTLSNLTRGIEGSTAATHGIGSAVTAVLTAGSLNQAFIDRSVVLATNGVGVAGLPIKLNGGQTGYFADAATGAVGTSVSIRDPGSTTPIDAVNIGNSSGYVAYATDSDFTALGMPVVFKFGATAAATAYLAWSGSLGLIDYTTKGRAYVKLSANPGQTLRFTQWLENGASRGYIEITSGRIVQIRDQSNNIVGTSTALTAGIAYRFEWSTTRSATAGVITLNIYNGNSLTPLQTITTTGFNTGLLVTTITWGSVNNSNLGSMFLLVGAFADGCVTQPGVYTGPPSDVLNAAGASEVIHNGEHVWRATRLTLTDGGASLIRPGDEVTRIDAHGNLHLGVARTPYADYNNPSSSNSAAHGYDIATGRSMSESLVTMAGNDPTDWTGGRWGILNQDQTGTDAATNGSVAISPTFAATARWRGRRIILGGTTCYVLSVGTTTVAGDTLTLTDAKNQPSLLPVASGVAWSVDTSPRGRKTGTQGATMQMREQSFAYGLVRKGASGCTTDGSINVTVTGGAFTSIDVGRYFVVRGTSPNVFVRQIASVVDATHITVSGLPTSTIPALSNQPWSVCQGNADESQGKSPLNSMTIGVTHDDDPILIVDDSGSKNFGPADITFAVARDDKFYTDNEATPVIAAMRGRSGYFEAVKGVNYGDTNNTRWAVAPNDTHHWRSRASVVASDAIGDYSSQGFAGKVVGHVPTDADFIVTPPDGQEAIDTSSTPPSKYTRISGVWTRITGDSGRLTVDNIWTGENVFTPATSKKAWLAKNSTTFNLTNGGTPKWQVQPGAPVAWVDEHGNFFIGENYLAETEASAGTDKRLVADFVVAANTRRFTAVSGSLRQNGDPADLNLGRCGPDGGFPYGGASATITATGTTTVTVGTGGTGIFRSGQRVTTTDGTFKVAGNITITGGTAIGVQNPVSGTLTLSAALATGTYTLFSVGRPQDLCGNGAGTNTGQIRSSPFLVPTGGDTTTAGAVAQQGGAMVQLGTGEMPRDLTGNSDNAAGGRLLFTVCRKGTDDYTDLMMINQHGKVLIGEQAISGSGNDPTAPKVNIRGHSGQNESQTITKINTPAAGTVTLTIYGSPASDTTYPTNVVTGSLAYNASIATVQTALDTVLGASNTVVSGGALNTGTLVITFAGTLASLPFPLIVVTPTGVTGGSFSVVRTTRGIPSDSANTLFSLRHGGSGVPTGRYVRIQDGSGGDVWVLQNDGSVRMYGALPLVDSREAAAASTSVRTSRVTGDSQPRFVDRADGKRTYGTGSAVVDVGFGRLGVDLIGTDTGDILVANGGLGVGNSASATTPGSVVKKMQVFDAAGASLGYVPIYSTIT